MFNVVEEHYFFILINFSKGEMSSFASLFLGEIQAMKKRISRKEF